MPRFESHPVSRAALIPAQAQRDARALADRVARPGDWLAQVLRHHQQIEAAFAGVGLARDAHSRTAAQRRLLVLLNAHEFAEETVLYPALARGVSPGDASTAYAEQADCKTRWSDLDELPPMSEAYLRCIDTLQALVSAHAYHEEGLWFLAMKEDLPEAEQLVLGQRYREQFARYVGLETPR